MWIILPTGRQMAFLSSASFPVPQCNDVITRVSPPRPCKHWEYEQFELAMNALVPKTPALPSICTNRHTEHVGSSSAVQHTARWGAEQQHRSGGTPALCTPSIPTCSCLIYFLLVIYGNGFFKKKTKLKPNTLLIGQPLSGITLGK